MKTFPKKSDYRSRAHCNPFMEENMEIFDSPDSISWKNYYKTNEQPVFLDIGCGYGKFLIELANENTTKNICGIEIRKKIAEYVNKRIEVLRENNNECHNAHVFNTNALIFLPNFFAGNSIEKIFILFPDPQFKKKKHKARIVCLQMIPMYHFLLKMNGRIYISTDVEELFVSMVESFKGFECFKRLCEEECNSDQLFKKTFTRTDESFRAAVKTGCTFAAIFEKIE